MDSKSALKKLLAVAEQGAVIKFSMPAGPESDEFYSNLVRKFGQDAVSRTVKENCSAMNPHSKTQTTETVCSLTKIETTNDSFYQQLRSTLKEDIDWNFIDFVIDYLLSTDKDGQQAADVDKLIQNYVKLNPQLREQLVAMLKSLAEAKEIRIEPSRETVVIPKRSPKIKTDEVSLVASRKVPLVPKSPSSSRSLKRHSLNLSQVASTRGTSSDANDESTPEPPHTSSSQCEAESPLCLERLADPESSKPTMLSKPNVSQKSPMNETESPDASLPADCSSKPPEPPAPPPSPRSDQPQVQVGYLRVVGATAKALQLLRSEDHFVDDISLVHTTPKRIDDSDCDEVFNFAGCTYDEFVRLGSSGTATKKRKKRNKKKNRKKNYSATDEEVPLALEPDPDSRDGTSDVTASNSTEDVTASGLSTETTDHQSIDDYHDTERDHTSKERQEHRRLAVSKEACQDLCLKNTLYCNHETPSTSCGHTSAVLGKPLRLVKDIESRAPRSLARSEILLEKELRFQSVSQADPCVVTSWDDLKELVAEVFPNDSELQEAFARKAHNSLDLWRFIVKYGRMYKDFVSEVLEMVNELKKGLIDAMDMHREKTNEILETHKKEMCAVVEKARAADCRIEVLEKELQDHRLLADEQKVKAFTQEEEIQKLQKDVTAKDKKLRDLDNTRKELLSERIKAKEEKERLAAEHEKIKSELLETQSECDSLRSRLKRSREGAEETDYRLRELESKLCDEQIEKEKLKESNAALTKKTEALQKELEKLREKQAQQRKKEMTHKSTSVNPLNLYPAANDSSVLPSRSVSSSSASSPRGSLCSPVISPMSSRCSNSQYYPSLNSMGYASSPERAVGSPSTKMFPQNPRNNQPSLRRPIPFSSRETHMSPNSYGFNSVGDPNGVCGPRHSYRDSAVGKQYRDSEVHSLLTTSEPQSELRNDYSLPKDRSVYNQTQGQAMNNLRGLKSPLGEPTVSASLPSPSFASLFSKDEAPAQPALPYSPWGSSTFDFSSPSAPLLFNIKPSSLSVTPTGHVMDPMSRFPEPDFRSLGGTPQKALDLNITNHNQGFNDPFRF